MGALEYQRDEVNGPKALGNTAQALAWVIVFSGGRSKGPLEVVGLAQSRATVPAVL